MVRWFGPPVNVADQPLQQRRSKVMRSEAQLARQRLCHQGPVRPTAHYRCVARNRANTSGIPTAALHENAILVCAFFSRRELASSTRIKDAAVINVLIAAMVGSISSRNETNMRLVSG